MARTPSQETLADRAERIGLPRGLGSEAWAWVPGWRGRYAASTEGRVASLRTTNWHILAPGRGTKYGHRKVMLGNGTDKNQWVHRLILRTFIGEPADGQIARHLDGDPSNNALTNLSWGTPSENNADMVEHGRATRGSRNTQSKLTEQDVYAIRALRHVAPADYVARLYGVKPNTIAQIWGSHSWKWLADAG